MDKLLFEATRDIKSDLKGSKRAVLTSVLNNISLNLDLDFFIHRHNNIS